MIQDEFTVLLIPREVTRKLLASLAPQKVSRCFREAAEWCSWIPNPAAICLAVRKFSTKICPSRCSIRAFRFVTFVASNTGSEWRLLHCKFSSNKLNKFRQCRTTCCCHGRSDIVCFPTHLEPLHGGNNRTPPPFGRTRCSSCTSRTPSKEKVRWVQFSPM